MRWWPTLEVVPAWEQTVVQHCRQRSGAYVVWPLAAIVPNRRGARTSFGALRGVLSMNLMATEEELKAEIARLRAENQALQRPARGQMSLRVSEKGALSVYGLGRFPVTLYREQWEKLLGMADEIRAFIQENDGALKKKE